jgi:prepilin-type N-terminal cleavage/methylation domain-containing protein
VKRRLRKLRTNRGYTVIELLTSMVILTVILGAVVGVFVSSSNAQINANRRFQAQQGARMAVERMRREVHCASTITPVGRQSRASLTMPAGCPGAPAATTITYCTRLIDANRYALHRIVGAYTTCTGGAQIADYVSRPDPFHYTLGSPGRLSTLEITMPVDITPANTAEVWTLTDNLVLRNGTRS